MRHLSLHWARLDMRGCEAAKSTEEHTLWRTAGMRIKDKGGVGASFRGFRSSGFAPVLLVALFFVMPSSLLTAQSLDAKLQLAQQLLEKLKTENEQLKNSLQSSQGNWQQLSQQYSSLESNWESLNNEFKLLQNSYQQLEQASTQSAQEYQKLLNAQEALAVSLTSLQDSYKKLEMAYRLSPQTGNNDGLIIGVVAGAGGIVLGVAIGLLAGTAH